MNWYLEALKKYAQFSGRSRRKEYWLFVLFNMIISFVLTFIDAFTGTLNPELGLGLLSGIYSLAVLIPSIAVGFRRLHDTGRSAWWFLLFLLPLIGLIVILIFLLQDSKEEENKYGVSPKLAP
jgi:uncharacterized membrane protein YhaH (DUF805 family)